MFNVLLVAILLSGSGVSVDNGKPAHRKEANTVSDAGVDSAKTIRDRRNMFSEKIAEMADGVPVVIFWSTGAVDEGNDGAVVVIGATGSSQTALFFYYRKGEWKVLPDDFKSKDAL